MPIRPAAFAGSWYTSDAARLESEVAAHLAAADLPPLPGRVVALIAPHAGLRYSGAVAACAYKALVGRRAPTAFLVGPAHRPTFRGISVHATGAFDTPRGRLAIDEAAAARLLEGDSLIVDAPGPHRDEHSLEMQLPFLHHVAPEATIVPMLMGEQSRDEVEALAPALAEAARLRTDAVLIASSDLSHYHPAVVANALDAQVVDDVARFDPESLMARLETSHEHACGGGPMVAVMKAARQLGASRATVLRYADSGDAGERDKRRVVGYLAAAFTT